MINIIPTHFRDIEDITLLNSGTFGTVYSAVRKGSTKIKVAIKVLLFTLIIK
jgi:serine/threonine protein kinase